MCPLACLLFVLAQDDMSIGKLPDDKPAVTFMTDDLDLDLPKGITKSGNMITKYLGVCHHHSFL